MKRPPVCSPSLQQPDNQCRVLVSEPSGWLCPLWLVPPISQSTQSGGGGGLHKDKFVVKPQVTLGFSAPLTLVRATGNSDQLELEKPCGHINKAAWRCTFRGPELVCARVTNLSEATHSLHTVAETVFYFSSCSKHLVHSRCSISVDLINIITLQIEDIMIIPNNPNKNASGGLAEESRNRSLSTQN